MSKQKKRKPFELVLRNSDGTVRSVTKTHSAGKIAYDFLKNGSKRHEADKRFVRG